MQQYSGPIFDGDTHIYEQADAYSRYLPEKYRKALEVRHVEEDGKYPLYVGPWKIPPGEDAMRLIDGKVKIPAPGMLHVWLKRLNEGNAEMDWVEMPKEALYRDARIKWMDEKRVEACSMFPGEMNTVPAFVEDQEGLLAMLSAYNRWFGEEWGFNYKDRIFATAMLSFEDKDWAKKEIDTLLKQGRARSHCRRDRSRTAHRPIRILTSSGRRSTKPASWCSTTSAKRNTCTRCRRSGATSKPRSRVLARRRGCGSTPTASP
jgi:hypothetical protein